MNQQEKVISTGKPAAGSGTGSYKKTYVPQYRFCRFDAAVIVLVVLLAVGVAAGLYVSAKNTVTAGSHLEAVVLVEGKEAWRVNLADITSRQTHKFAVAEGSLTVTAESGKACISAADCPDQICVRTGWLTSAGQTAVCLPNKAVLKVISVDGGGSSAGGGSAAGETSALYDAISK